MASRSRAGRLALLASVLVFTGLDLSWDRPRIDAPGEGEGEGGGGTGLFCPFCGHELSKREDEGGAFFCRVDGPIDEDQALTSPPETSPPKTRS